MFLKPSSSPTSLLKLGLSPTFESLNLLLISIVESSKLALIPFLLSQFTSISSPTHRLCADRIALRCLVLSLSARGEAERAVQVLEMVKDANVGPQGFCERGKVDEAFTVLKKVEESGIGLHEFVYAILIHGLCKVGVLDRVFCVLEEMERKMIKAGPVTYNTVINGKIEEARQVFDEYRQTSLVRNAACHNCIIRGLCKEHMVEIAVEVFEDLIEKKLVLDTSIYRTLTRAQFVEGGEEGVRKFIHKIQDLEPKLLSLICNDAVAFLCANNCFEGAIDIYLLMRRRGAVITSKSYYQLLRKLVRGQMKHVNQLIMNDFVKAYGMFESKMINILLFYLSKKNVDTAIRFMGIAGKQNICVSVLTAIVCALKKEDRANDAYEFLMAAEKNGLPLDIVVYSSVVEGLCKEGHLGNALDLCERMKKKGMCPNIITYNSVINGLCHQGSLVMAFRLFDSLEHNNVFPTVVTHAILISALSREGFMQDAKDLFGKMITKGITPNIRIYNILINGYCSFGLIEEAEKLIMDIDESGLQPDAFTVSAVISGFCLRGDVQGALDLFTHQRRRENFPDFLGFMNLIKGLFANGRVEEARSILRDMLQCVEVVNLINYAGDELNIESLVSLLGLACDQGRIKEVIDVLNEVMLTAFSTWRSESDYRIKHLKRLQEVTDSSPDVKMVGPGKGDSHLMEVEVPRHIYDVSKSTVTADAADTSNKLCKMGKEDGGNKDYEHLIGKPLLQDFDSYYSIIASLCSKGELQKANSIVRAMLINSEKC
ncbi:hypothetical protein J5N97_014620 [Dioscorea zingiberensis]|uniref:Pentatricopeptide repeat-containing protein n=1 Tax=Dioscorea zingiberensis TaxID=325984 RepID=A0A9D5CST7_9LILI|nr:hypothetical protein J5N97_014620 [Dioscorea zingiberensis]